MIINKSSRHLLHSNSFQSYGMNVLDEKANGGPSMEVDEVVSVRDREWYTNLILQCVNLSYSR